MAKINPLIPLYRKERKRIFNYLSYYRRKYGEMGLGFDVTVPKIPKKITEGSIRRLQKITPEYIKSKAFLADTETGEIISTGEEAIKNEKTIKKQARAADVIIQNFQEMIDSWAPSSIWNSQFEAIKQNDRNRLKNILDGAIIRNGKTEVARRLEENAFELQSLFEEILYGSGSKEYEFSSGRQQVNHDLLRVARILNGRSLTPSEAINLQQQADELEYE